MKPVKPYDHEIIAALTSASLALSASHNLTVTDRASLPREQWPIYVLDHLREIVLIDAVLVALSEPSNIDTDPECGCCNSSPSTLSA